MYPDTGSDLHAFGTDRFVAEWRPEDKGDASAAGAARGTRDDVAGRGDALSGATESLVECVEIPVDAESLRDNGVAELRAWRERTRAAITGLLRRGYEVTGFERLDDRCHYLLTPRRV
jgi:predicted GNAT superfamily acetyltransferase